MTGSGHDSLANVDVFEPGSSGWQAARRLFDASLDRRPGKVFKPRTQAAAIAVATAFQRDGQSFGIKSGGHSAAGLSVLDGEPLLDVSLLRQVRVDGGAKVATVDPGALMSDLDAATSAVSMATTGGTVSHTGVIGLSAGGGIGWLMGRFGLACDNIMEAVVIANGEVHRITEDSPNMWLMRGAGVSMGFIASLKLRLHENDSVFDWTTWHNSHQLFNAITHFSASVGRLPPCVGSSLTLASSPEGSMDVFIDVVAPTGSVPDEWLAEARPPGSQSRNTHLSYPEVQRTLDADFPFGRRSYRRSLCVADLSELNIDSLIDVFSRPTPFRRTLTVDVLHGRATSPEQRRQSCFPRYRFTLLLVCQWLTPDLDEAGRAAGRELIDLIRPAESHRQRAAYGNYSSEAVDSLQAGIDFGAPIWL
jgi:FAD binding domain